jgi:PAS domain S-box-containing protein
VAAGTPIDGEARLRRFDGEYRWFLFRPAPARDETGNIIGWYGIITDIEDRKRAEDALRESEARLSKAERELQHMLDSIPTMIVRGATNGYIEYLNKQWFEYTGTTLETARGFRWQQSLHPDDKDRLVEFGARFVASAEPADCEARLRRFDGEYRWFLFRPAPARDEAGTFVAWYGIVTDIEDRKRAEAELRRSETLLAEGQRLSLTGTFSWLVDTNRIAFSQELLRIFEFEPGAFLTLGRLRERTHPEDRALMDEKVSAVRAGRDTPEYEIKLRMPDNRIKYIRIIGRLIRRQDGRLECLGAIRDVTQGRNAEASLDKVRSELAHVTRAVSLGALTASIAHEVNQPLAGIITNASTCLRMLAADPPNVEGARETARRTIRDGNRAADVIARLRALFSRKASGTEAVDLNEATREVLSLVSSDLRRNSIILRVELDDDNPLFVIGDRVQLQQVILNLVRNASDAMSEVNNRPRHLLVRAGREEDGSARVIVRDMGIGLEPQSIERLFDAFYTTKSDGMGIGLSVSRSIIESHGGRLWAEPNDGPGATFSFSIPRQDTSAADEGTAGALPTRPTAGAHDLTRNA